MFVTEAYAQTVGAGGGGAADFIITLLPLVAIFLVFYFLMIRPQQKRMKEHREMVANLRRGDTVVTSGGLIGKVNRVDDNEVQVEIAEGTRVRVVRSMIAEVRSKTEPQAANNN